MNAVSMVYLSFLTLRLTPRVAWISWLTVAILLGTLSLALFNASKEPIARNFAYAYAAISIGVVVIRHLTASELLAP